MSFNPSKFVLFLAAYLPLEEFILKWLPVPDTIYLALRQVPDALIFLLALLILCDRLMRFRGLRGFGRTFDFLLLAFLVSSTISLLLNQAQFLPWLAHQKALLRYVFLAYVVHTFPMNQRNRNRFVKILLVSVVIQMGLGMIQLVGGVTMRDFLGARNTTEDIAGFKADFTGTRFEEANNLMGTMGNTIDYGTFLLVGLAIFLCLIPRRRKILRASGVASSLLCIALTNSRSALIASIVLILGYTYLEYGKRRVALLGGTVLLCGFGALLVLSGVDSYQAGTDDSASRLKFFHAFSSDYVEEAMNQRLGLVVYVAPNFLTDVSAVSFGFSPDTDVLVDATERRYANVPQPLLENIAGIIEDVYWLALLIYFGIVGATLFVSLIGWAIWRLAKAYRQESIPDNRAFILFALLLMIASIPLNFFNQVFLMRQFSLCLWAAFALALPSKAMESNANPVSA